MLAHPNNRFSLVIVARASVLWFLLRTVAAGVGALTLSAAPVDALAPAAAVSVTLLAAGLTLLDVYRSGEELFLADLGVSPGSVGALAVVPPLMFELVVDGWLL